MSRHQQTNRPANEKRPARWRGWALSALCALLALYALALLYEGFISDRFSSLLTFPFVDKPAAERAYDRLPASASPDERAQAAERLTLADPANPESWTAVAYADWLRAHRLSPKGLVALDHSYAVSFFDRPGAVWRVGFCLQNWSNLTPQIRHDVLAEAQVALNDPRLGPELRAQMKTIQDPAGRLAAQLLLASPPAASH